MSLLSTVNGTLIFLVLVVLANQLSSAIRSQVLTQHAGQSVARAYADAPATPMPELLPSDATSHLDSELADLYRSIPPHDEWTGGSATDRPDRRSRRWDPWGREIAVFEQSVAGVGMAPGGGRFAVSAGPDRSFATSADNIFSYDQAVGAFPAPATAGSTGQAEP